MKRLTAVIAAVTALGMATPSWSQDNGTTSFSQVEVMLNMDQFDLLWVGIVSGVWATNTMAEIENGSPIFCPPPNLLPDLELAKSAIRSNMAIQRLGGADSFGDPLGFSVAATMLLGLQQLFPCK